MLKIFKVSFEYLQSALTSIIEHFILNISSFTLSNII